LLDAAAPEDAAAAPLCIASDIRGTGHTFTDLYQDYFGRVGGSGCAGNGRCHGAADQPGSIASHNFVCPPADKDTCYQGLQTAALATSADEGAPEQSGLYLVLRKSSGGGSMPKAPVCAFDDTDMKRIADWIRAGAPND